MTENNNATLQNFEKKYQLYAEDMEKFQKMLSTIREKREQLKQKERSLQEERQSLASEEDQLHRNISEYFEKFHKFELDFIKNIYALQTKSAEEYNFLYQTLSQQWVLAENVREAMNEASVKERALLQIHSNVEQTQREFIEKSIKIRESFQRHKMIESANTETRSLASITVNTPRNGQKVNIEESTIYNIKEATKTFKKVPSSL